MSPIGVRLSRFPLFPGDGGGGFRFSGGGGCSVFFFFFFFLCSRFIFRSLRTLLIFMSLCI
ncbi:hypothetical protein HanRHA438_Chr07g0300811 [Helianthus annuus]|nr:hypothetical protein HanRHA438_Chr07g0300811 [Helianthus annuus]